MRVKNLFSVATGAFLVFLSLLACSIVLAEESDVISLTKDTFKTIVEPEKLILIEFFAPWCGHCKALAPEYEEAATALKAENIKLAKVDCTAETELCAEHEIKGYPTLKVFKDGKASEYNGGREANLIISYMKKQALPARTAVNIENFDTFKDSDDKVVIGFFNADDQKEFNIFSQISEELRDDFVFGETGQKEVITKAEVKPPAVILYKKFDEGKNVLEGTFTKEELTSFIKKNALPLLAEIGQDNYASYVDSGLPLAFIFYDDDEQRTDLGKEIEPVAKEFKGKVNFVFIDATKFGQHADNINLKQTWPAFGISLPDENLKYPFNQSKEITTESIRDFVDKFVKGEITPSIKSEPIPEKNDDSVFVLVADNFESVVFNDTKDVLVEFYAPWCGHCKKLAPTYEKLGEVYKNVKDKILVAKMDSTENDLPPKAKFQIAGFPTIKLFKAGDNEIVDYSGDRSYESLVEFLDKNAHNKVDLESSTPEPSSSKEPAPTTTAVKDKHEEL
ncbi:protein disulfide isomerase PDI1 [Rhizophagus irregularis DAOM 197198w]|uniref:Protein disulfide-isomerase n=1 Tax=Rhizophagus irregularis (strain DAOM 197198w) TaxID=1432141 RepID=A0A015KEW5_RHIIW|nr:protein disulfide isomerase PDI1 [Rhizophagus irregularis DAOM 197198w]